MASQANKQRAKQRKKKRKEKEKQENPRPSQRVVEDSRNLLRIGGTVGDVREAQEREGRLWLPFRLRCEDRPRTVTHAWANVYDTFSDYVAERLAMGRAMCLGGYIRSLEEPHPITHDMWELYVIQVLCLDRTNQGSGYFACNEILARGKLAYCKPGTFGEHRNYGCEFGLQCEGPGRVSNVIKMIAFYRPDEDITAIIERRWKEKRELTVAARLGSYGDGYTRTGIRATAVLEPNE